MKLLTTLFIAALIVYCRSQPQLKHGRHSLSNNSYVYYYDIRDRDSSLMCVTDNVNCCNSSTVGGWRDVRGAPVQGADGTTCLYVTRGDGVISLHRNRSCTDHTSGLWRCDIPDSSGEMQSLYIYISDKIRYNPPGKMRNKVFPHSITLEYRTTQQLSDYELYSTH